MGLPLFAMLAAIAAVALAEHGNLRGAAAQPWDYASFHVGDWQEKGYPLCAGLPALPEHPHNEWQSPIDIPPRPDGAKARADDGEGLQLSAEGEGCHRVRMEHNGHTWEANFAALGCTSLVATWKGKNYTMQELHFHVESENMLGGHHQDMEVHMVHQADDGSQLVIAQFLARSQAVDEENPFLNETFRLFEQTYRDVELSGMLMNPYAGLLRAGEEFYSFLGSLTTPPCTSGLEWIVMREPTWICPGDMDSFEEYLMSPAGYQADSYGRDDRPVQPLNGRPIALGSISATNFLGGGTSGAPALSP